MIFLLICPCDHLQISVPRQKNGFNCGLFLCRYALGIYKLREQTFTYEVVYRNKTPLLKKVTNNALFIFNQKVVDDFRKQLGELCDNLYHVFHHGTVPDAPVHGTKRVNAVKKKTANTNLKASGYGSGRVVQQKAMDSTKELEYASPILEEIGKRNMHAGPHDAMIADAALPAVNLNAEAFQIPSTVPSDDRGERILCLM
jgi:hypothetical protein